MSGTSWRSGSSPSFCPFGSITLTAIPFTPADRSLDDRHLLGGIHLSPAGGTGVRHRSPGRPCSPRPRRVPESVGAVRDDADLDLGRTSCCTRGRRQSRPRQRRPPRIESNATRATRFRENGRAIRKWCLQITRPSPTGKHKRENAGRQNFPPNRNLPINRSSSPILPADEERGCRQRGRYAPRPMPFGWLGRAGCRALG